MPPQPGYRAAPGTDSGMATADALHRADGEVASFPTRAVVILALAMTVTSYSLVSLFPYVGMMVKELLSLQSTNEAGFYAGYVASAFTFGRFLSGYVWGYLTDSIGRKPVIIAGQISVAVFSLAFGFSNSYTWAVSSRLILGLTNATVPALRTSLSEICGPEHVVVGMTYLSSCKAISMVFGTGIGGILAQPAVHFPGVFSTTGLFGRYPFLLPNLVGAIGALVVLVLVAVYLPETKGHAAAPKPQTASQQLSSDGGGNVTETVAAGIGDTFPVETPAGSPADNGISLNPIKYRSPTTAPANDGGNRVNGDGEAHSGAATSRHQNGSDNAGQVGEVPVVLCPRATGAAQGHDEDTPGVFGRNGLLATPHVKVILALVCVNQALMIGFEEAYPLFALSTPDVGGLGWSTLQIGKVLVMAGVLMSVFQLVLLPLFIKIIGIATWQRLGFVVGIPAFLAVPAVKMLSWNYPSLLAASVTTNTLVMCSLQAVNLALAVGSTTMVPSRKRGKLSGLFNTAESLGRFLGPAGFAISYAWSISPSGSASGYGWVDHNFVFYSSAVLMALCAVLAWPTLTTENLMKLDDDAVVEGESGEHSDSAAGSLSPVAGSGSHLDDALVSTAAVARREVDLV